MPRPRQRSLTLRSAEAWAPHTQPLTTTTLTCCKGGWNSLVLVRLSANLPCPWVTRAAPGSKNGSEKMPRFYHPRALREDRRTAAVLLTDPAPNSKGELWGKKG